MDALRIVKDSWNTLRQNRALWLFGFFGAAGGAGERLSQHGQTPAVLGVLLAVGAIVALALFGMQVLSEAALIDGVRRTRRGERYAVRDGFRAGAKFFWRVLGLKLGAGAVALVTMLVTSVPILAVRIAGGPLWAGVLGFAPLALLSVPWLCSVYFIYEFALRAVVVEDSGVRKAVSQGFSFLQGRLSLSLWLVVASGAGQVVAGFAGLALAIPVALVAGLVYLTAGLVPAAVTAAAVFAPIAACLVGALGTYRSGVWTHGYLLGRVESA
jgi:hypothetical protein